jgi:hypothetical protein
VARAVTAVPWAASRRNSRWLSPLNVAGSSGSVEASATSRDGGRASQASLRTAPDGRTPVIGAPFGMRAMTDRPFGPSNALC